MIRLALAIVLLASPAIRVSIQILTVRPATDVLRVAAPGFSFLEGPVLDRLKDGRSAQLDFELQVLTKPRGDTIAKVERSFTVSLDLWEERFTVSTSRPLRSISHLRAPDAEAWCLDNLTVPLTSFGRQKRDAPFWVHLEYRVVDPDAQGQGGDLFSLGTLIDRLSRRPQKQETGKSIDGGPFQLK